MQAQQLEGWLLVDQAARKLGISAQHFHNLMWQGQVNVKYLGDPDRKPIYVVAEAEVERLREKRESAKAG